jgi:rSAM/selenodomain-associated transferase 2
MALISVVIPALNEASQIGACLEQFQALLGDWELIVVDGGSGDATVALAQQLGARVLQSTGGRGPQLNAGAAAATGDILLFLHADARLPLGASGLILRGLKGRGVAGGCFRVHHAPDRWLGTWKARLLVFADLRSRYTRHPYGDQGLFLLKSVFLELGGYPPVPLMEDLAFSRKLAGRGRIVTLRPALTLSARRFESGLLRAFLCMNSFPFLARLGVGPARLHRWYGQPRS